VQPMSKSDAVRYLAQLRYIPAAHQGQFIGKPTLVVDHDMEAAERSTTAENCAGYFATTDRVASVQFNVDNDSTVRSVPDTVEGYHAGRGEINRCSAGIEHAGFASQTYDQWKDDYSYAMIWGQSARLHAALHLAYGIPLEFVDAAALRAGRRHGVTTHWEVTKAFNVRGGHTDPGLHFPMGELLRAARDIVTGDIVQLPTSGEQRMITFTNAGGGLEQMALYDGTLHTWWEVPFKTDLGGPGQPVPGVFKSLGGALEKPGVVWIDAVQDAGPYGIHRVTIINSLENGVGVWKVVPTNQLRAYLAGLK
jgi:hypothetical protein